MKRFLLISSLLVVCSFTLNGQESVAFTDFSTDNKIFTEVPLIIDSTSGTITTAEDRRAAALERMRRPTSPIVFYSPEQIKIILWSNEEANAVIKIHTADGRLVKEIETHLTNSKENEILIPVSDLSRGAYWINFFKEGQLLSSREYIKS